MRWTSRSQAGGRCAPTKRSFWRRIPKTKEAPFGWDTEQCTPKLYPAEKGQYLKDVVDEMKRLNVTAVVFGDPNSVQKWKDAAGDRRYRSSDRAAEPPSSAAIPALAAPNRATSQRASLPAASISDLHETCSRFSRIRIPNSRFGSCLRSATPAPITSETGIRNSDS